MNTNSENPVRGDDDEPVGPTDPHEVRRRPAPGTTNTHDLARQITVAISAVIAVVGSFIGSGAAGGTPIQDAAGGALAADATLLAPGSGAFSIWSLIYFGLLVYAVWQFVPAQRSEPRHRAIGWLAALSLILNAAWILSIQFNLLGMSLPIIIVLVAVLGTIFVRMRRTPPVGRIDALVTDGTFGLYLGWVTIATVANAAAVLKAAGFTGWRAEPEVLAVSVLVVAAVIGVALAVFGAGRIAPMLSLCWGIAWIAVARLTDEPASTAVGVAAIGAVVVIVLATVLARVRAQKATT